jgi:hypothetical protein
LTNRLTAGFKDPETNRAASFRSRADIRAGFGPAADNDVSSHDGRDGLRGFFGVGAEWEKAVRHLPTIFVRARECGPMGMERHRTSDPAGWGYVAFQQWRVVTRGFVL